MQTESDKIITTTLLSETLSEKLPHQPEFSVLMSVYRGDRVEYVRQAIKSITSAQTLPPNEVLIVQDGPVSEDLAEYIETLEGSTDYNFKIIKLTKNQGLGNALNVGLKNVSNELVARMDADDIAAPNRFELQLEYFIVHPQCDILGGQISEFIDRESNIVGHRIVPCEHEEIYVMLRSRCPFNHISVMFRRSSVLSVGNYLDWHFNEDYYLWIRMALAKAQFANLPETLVNVRVGTDMYRRRGSWKYFRSEEGLQRYMLKNRIISLPRYLFNTCVRFIIQVVLPSNFRGWLFQKLFRK